MKYLFVMYFLLYGCGSLNNGVTNIGEVSSINLPLNSWQCTNIMETEFGVECIEYQMIFNFHDK